MTDRPMWLDLRQEFEEDGALRDIYATEVDEGAWERAYQFLLAQPGLVFRVAGEESLVPPSAMAWIRLHETGSPLLQFKRGGIEFACHFFCNDEIELDFWPQAIEGQESLDDLGLFISELGRAARRDIVVTHENGPELRILRYDLALDHVVASIGTRDHDRAK